jgi:hypothetical protein
MVAVLAGLLLPDLAVSQRPVTWAGNARLRTDPRVAAVVVRGTIDAGWHIYAVRQPPGGPQATRLSVPTGSNLRLDSIAESPVQSGYDSTFAMQVLKHRSRVELRGMIVAEAPIRSDTVVVLRVRYQACTAVICLPPRTDTVNVTVRR